MSRRVGPVWALGKWTSTQLMHKVLEPSNNFDKVLRHFCYLFFPSSKSVSDKAGEIFIDAITSMKIYKSKDTFGCIPLYYQISYT